MSVDLAYRWAADPFAKEMRVSGPKGYLMHSPLGACVEILSYMNENPQDLDPVRKLLIEVLSAFAPETLTEIEQCQCQVRPLPPSINRRPPPVIPSRKP